MKTPLLSFLFTVFLPMLSSSQVITDVDHFVQLALKKMALNYRDLDVKKYTIEYREKYEGQGAWREKFTYEYLNDSTLFHRQGFYGDIFLLRDNEFIRKLPRQDTSGNSQYFKENSWKVIDSAGVTYTYRYSHVNGDTLLQSIYSIEEKDSVKTESSKYLSQGKWAGNQTTTTILTDGSIRKEIKVFRENDWFKLFDSTESTSISRTDSSEIEVISRKGKQYDGIRGSNEVVSDNWSELHIEVFYDSKGMITKIIINDSNNIHNAIRTLRPKKIKMFSIADQPKR